jgi:hypothetical protein
VEVGDDSTASLPEIKRGSGLTPETLSDLLLSWSGRRDLNPRPLDPRWLPGIPSVPRSPFPQVRVHGASIEDARVRCRLPSL